MKGIISCIEQLRIKLERHRTEGLKEYPTRTIFIDPLLYALGWDVRDPDEVHLEYPTIDGKSVDYAPKLNRRPVLFIEAKALNDSLTDVKSITQVVGYASNAGVEWCILTNGVTYRIYRSTEKTKAPDKLLYQVSIDPKDAEGVSIQDIAKQFQRFSKESMASGVLDEIGEQVFVTGKIRKALDKLFTQPPNNFIRIIRSRIDDDNIKPKQIEAALKRLWAFSSDVEIFKDLSEESGNRNGTNALTKGKIDYGEEHHIGGKPQEVIELYKSIDKYCRELDQGNMTRKYLSKTINYLSGKKIFCSINISNIGLRIWVKLIYSKLVEPPVNVRDVSNLGHWGVGDVEIKVNRAEELRLAEPYIRQSYEKNR